MLHFLSRDDHIDEPDLLRFKACADAAIGAGAEVAKRTRSAHSLADIYRLQDHEDRSCAVVKSVEPLVTH